MARICLVLRSRRGPADLRLTTGNRIRQQDPGVKHFYAPAVSRIGNNSITSLCPENKQKRMPGPQMVYADFIGPWQHHWLREWQEYFIKLC